jgi:hypothetical protein
LFNDRALKELSIFSICKAALFVPTSATAESEDSADVEDSAEDEADDRVEAFDEAEELRSLATDLSE